jgi:putative transposase
LHSRPTKPRCSAGSGNGSASSGPDYLNTSVVAREDPPSPLMFETLSCEWLTANPLWRAPRIHGELQMLGIAVSERTVSRIIRTIRSRPRLKPGRRFCPITSLRSCRLTSLGFRRSGCKSYSCSLVLEHRRREVLHFNVTDHPRPNGWHNRWSKDSRTAKRLDLIRDRDGVYGNEVGARLRTLRIEEVLTAPQSPWQNPYAERLIGSIRRECLNHCIILKLVT